MKYGSVCSGIEAATVAWHPLGWEAQWLAEVEPFPSAVLQYHYPNVPNMGDMTKFKEWPDAALDVLVGGTPCQSFSVAGLRKGLDDPRGNLMLTYLAIALKYRPKWLVWENVPGVLSSNGGKDFGTFLGGLGELGYGFAYRVLDAQYFGVAQRRRRVFVVGCLGSWQRAAAVLFERDSLCGNTPPSREKRQDIAGTIAKCSFTGGAGGRPEGAAGNHFLAIGVDEECNASIEHFGPLLRGGQGGTRQAVAYGVGEKPEIAHCLRSGASKADKHESTTYVLSTGPTGTLCNSGKAAGSATQQDAESGMLVPVCMSTGQAGAEIGIGIGTTLNCNHEAPIVFSAKDHGADATTDLSPTLRAGGFDKSHANSGNWMAVAYGIPGNWIGRKPENGGNAVEPMVDLSPCQTKTDRHAVAFTQCDAARDASTEIAMALRSGGQGGYPNHSVATQMQVRRLTPVECERLQGFPDGYTNIPWRGKPESPDGPRYKALGNSMAVPVMRWIGERIETVDSARV